MKTINRIVVIIKPKQPYINWANSFDDGGPTLSEDDTYDKGTVYLIPECDLDYIEKSLKFVEKNYAKIFENELYGWMTDPKVWPQKRTLKLFKEWFEVEIYDMVYDLCKKSIFVEDW